MAKYLRQAVSAETITVKVGPFVSSVDLTLLATATITAASILLSKMGGQAAGKNESTAPTLDAGVNGFYLVTLNATDLGTLGRLRIISNQTGYIPLVEDFTVLSQANYDAEIAATGVSKYDLIDAPNSTAVTAIQNGLSKPGTAQTISSNSDITTIKGTTDKLETMVTTV